MLRSRVQALALLEEYEKPALLTREEAPPAPPGAWDRFLPASRDDACLDYLYDRGFDKPERVADTFDLRYSPRGEYAGRLLFPLYDAALEPKAWTGRTIRNREPRYKTLETDDAASLVATSPAHVAVARGTPNTSLIVVEGPLDALKINAYAGMREVVAIGITGLNLTQGRLDLIAQWKPINIFLCLDSEKPIAGQTRMLHTLSRQGTPVIPLSLPSGYKDPGEVHSAVINPWIKGAIDEAIHTTNKTEVSRLRVGRAV
jgi:DNA primase